MPKPDSTLVLPAILDHRAGRPVEVVDVEAEVLALFDECGAPLLRYVGRIRRQRPRHRGRRAGRVPVAVQARPARQAPDEPSRLAVQGRAQPGAQTAAADRKRQPAEGTDVAELPDRAERSRRPASDQRPTPSSNWSAASGGSVCSPCSARCPNGTGDACRCGPKASATGKSPTRSACRSVAWRSRWRDR